MTATADPSTSSGSGRWPQLATNIAGLPLHNAVVAASGCAGSGRELARFTDLDRFGAVITRSVTLSPRAGGPSPRLVESPSGLVNAIGLPGPGIEAFCEDELPWLVGTGAVVIVSIWGERAGDYAAVAQELRQAPGVAAIEVNLSNPVAQRIASAEEPGDAAGVVHQVRRHTAGGVPVLAKLGVDGGDTVTMARAVVNAGADALSLINAVRAMVVDPGAGRPALGSGFGGLSGPAIRPLALRAVWDVHAALPQVPIVASGGVMSGADALEMVLAGACAVAVGTALLNDPVSGERIAAELAGLLAARGASVPELVGAGHDEAPTGREDLA